MKPRNREVNIFNMSLLDILCGALGAFCFMMLSLFPDHAKVKDLQARLSAAERNTGGGNAEERARQAAQRQQQAEQRAQEAEKKLQQAKADQSLILFKIAWDGQQDLDLWLEGGGGKYCSPKENLIPTEKQGHCNIFDQKKGPAVEQAWFSDAVYTGGWYRLFARLQDRHGDASPATVHGYLAVRWSRPDKDMMTVEHFYAPLPKEHELVELGWTEFSQEGIKIMKGAKPNGDRLGAQMLQPPPELRFSPPAAPAAATSQPEQWRVDRWR